ncbi:MAG: 7-carboxy-7-deazaguanine synthase QueE [Bacteroidia bacterium]|nr:7-carboxy-7-deazaguanine synthase QueE [Bacteroidia bacterium]MDW8134365.1 7-carboxy-7-deazaguanine synthase QueE [Bacteroidia bacterium]
MSSYPIVEHFYSLQGEGYWAGRAAYFIRLGGCDIGCSWCDTQYSWPLEGWKNHTPETILSWIRPTPARHVVITGGEPTLHPLGPLIRALQEEGLFVQLETSGAYPPPEHLPDWITFSPKRFRPPHPAYYEVAHELKVVIHAPSDLQWAETQRNLCKSNPVAFLQPEAYEPNALNWVLPYIQENPIWRLSLQLHRYIGIP